MKIIKDYYYAGKPKNYSRKGFICQCIVPVVYKEEKSGTLLDNINVKYKLKKIENNNLSKSYLDKYNKNTWTSTSNYWGEFDKILELPKIFDKLKEDEFTIKISSFKRDGVQVPFVSEIEIYNSQKYKQLKTVMQRNKKLKNILNE